MKQGKPIRDASPGKGGGFLAKEREHLEKNGWKFNIVTNFWHPPA